MNHFIQTEDFVWRFFFRLRRHKIWQKIFEALFENLNRSLKFKKNDIEYSPNQISVLLSISWNSFSLVHHNIIVCHYYISDSGSADGLIQLLIIMWCSKCFILKRKLTHLPTIADLYVALYKHVNTENRVRSILRRSIWNYVLLSLVELNSVGKSCALCFLILD